MILQEANEQLSKEIKNTKLCKESIVKSQSIIQMSIDRKRVLGISLNKLERERRTSLKEKETMKICHVNGKGSFHNGNMQFIMIKYVWTFLETF